MVLGPEILTSIEWTRLPARIPTPNFLAREARLKACQPGLFPRTPEVHMRFVASIVTLLTLTTPGFAGDGGLAGPIWEEGPTTGGGGGSKDAGGTPQNSEEVSSPLSGDGGSTLTQVRGKTSESALIRPDLVDLFEIEITTPATFSASTVNVSTGFDTALFLFKKVVYADGTIAARPLVMNDNKSVQENRAALSAGVLANAQPGRYFIAVGKSGSMPRACLTAGGSADLFTYTPGSTEVNFASASQQGLDLCDWKNLGTGGDYSISLSGAIVPRASSADRTIALGAGTYAFQKTSEGDAAATRIGLGEPCGVDNAWIAVPNWFRLDACPAGTVTVRVCPTVSTASYQFMVYRMTAGGLDPMACGDPTTGCGGTGATLTWVADGCEEYLVAFGPVTTGALGLGATSAGTITITCTPDGATCGGGDAGSCFSNHTTPFCDSESCCAAVCAVDSYCCTVKWDATCVGEAHSICAPITQTADLDGNGVVDGGDLALLLTQWGS